MPTPAEDISGLAAAALVTALDADNDLQSLAPAGAWRDQLPQGETRAAIWVQQMSGVPGYSHSGMFERDLTFQVTGRTVIGQAALGMQIKARILAVLNNVKLTVAGGRTMMLQAKGEVDYADPPAGGVRFRYDGFLFKFEVAV